MDTDLANTAAMCIMHYHFWDFMPLGWWIRLAYPTILLVEITSTPDRHITYQPYFVSTLLSLIESNWPKLVTYGTSRLLDYWIHVVRGFDMCSPLIFDRLRLVSRLINRFIFAMAVCHLHISGANCTAALIVSFIWRLTACAWILADCNIIGTNCATALILSLFWYELVLLYRYLVVSFCSNRTDDI